MNKEKTKKQLTEREERFDSLYRELGIDKDTDFLRKLYNAYLRGHVDQSDAYSWIEGGAKSNYSNYKKGKKGFPENYVLAIEKLTGKSLADILGVMDGEGVSSFIPRGIRYAAYCDDAEAYRELSVKYNEWDSDVALFAHDEYGKNVLDYVIEYGSYNGLRYFIEECGMYFEDRAVRYKWHAHEDEGTVLGIWNMLMELDDPDLFNNAVSRVFTEEGYCRHKRSFNGRMGEGSIGGQLISKLPATDRIYRSLFAPRTISDGNTDVPAMHPCLETLLAYYSDKDDRICSEILDAYGRFVSAMISRIKEEHTREDLRNVYLVGDTLCHRAEDGREIGLMRLWDVETINFAFDAIASRVRALSLESILSGLEERSILDMQDGDYMLDREAGVYYVKCKRDLAIEMLEKMKVAGVTGIPEYYGEEHGVHSYEYAAHRYGDAGYDIGALRYTLTILADIYNASKSTLGSGRTYLHGKGIATALYKQSSKSYGARVLLGDWDRVTVGDPISDVVVALCELGRSEHYVDRRNETLLAVIAEGVSHFCDNYVKESLGDKLVDEIKIRLATADKKRVGRTSEFEELYGVLCFADMYRDELNSLFG